ncbi:MAG: hypothetical protein HYY35_06705 [Deltaproteobacteria bacterium]|nr:hypothetical protein [Deltaproteobacteria bacterium]
MGRFRKAVTFRSIVGLLAFAWIPYISSFCLDAEGCEILGVTRHHVDHHAQSGQRDVAPAAAHHEHPAAPASTCCEVTGKRAFAPTSQPGIAPQPSLAAPSIWPPAAICSVLADASSRRSIRALGPPTYLRNVSFRI